MRAPAEILIGKPAKEWTPGDFWKLRLFIGAAGAFLWALLILLLQLLHSAAPLPGFLVWATGAFYALILTVSAWIATARGNPFSLLKSLFHAIIRRIDLLLARGKPKAS